LVSVTAERLSPSQEGAYCTD